MTEFSIEDAIAEEVMYWFDVLEQHDPTIIKAEGFKKPVHPVMFKRIIPIVNLVLGDDWFIFDDADPRSVDWPMDVCLLGRQDTWLKWVIRRFVSATARQVRGKIPTVSKFMLKEYLWAAPREGAPVSVETYHSFINGRWGEADMRPKWVKVGRGFTDEMWAPVKQCASERLKDGLGGPHVACGLAFNMRYQWGVELEDGEDSPSILLPTDPSGVRSLFTHRERNPLTNRRDALLHWVRAHLRRRRADASDTAWVRKHLRGKLAFEWHGMRGTIHPAQFDLEEAIAKSNTSRNVSVVVSK